MQNKMYGDATLLPFSPVFFAAFAAFGAILFYYKGVKISYIEVK